MLKQKSKRITLLLYVVWGFFFNIAFMKKIKSYSYQKFDVHLPTWKRLPEINYSLQYSSNNKQFSKSRINHTSYEHKVIDSVERNRDVILPLIVGI